MKRVELIALWAGLSSVANVEGSIKWVYAIDKNKKKLKDEIENIQTVQQKIEDGRMTMCKELAEKNENGEPVMLEMKNEKDEVISSEFSIKDRSKLMEYMNSKNEEFKKFLDEDVKIELHKLKIEFVPEKGLTPKMFEGISAIIEE